MKKKEDPSKFSSVYSPLSITIEILVNKICVAIGLLHLVDLYVNSEDYADAEKIIDEILGSYDENENPHIWYESLVTKGRIFISRDKVEDALGYFTKSCINSLRCGLDFHFNVVSNVVKVLIALQGEEKEVLAEKIRVHLINSWKENGLEEKFPGFIEIIEQTNIDRDLQ